ncbi:hypothetical protein B0A68_20360 [Flavobacterium reichenbachii]|uniref:Uncharacterized protein n=1 Tax=Flavobacterium reichenbachii TaxID=362418 RepID=A0A085ZPV0_9FLAO|nr:hypothetical protein IW19_13520 [Flavobacterium reichenbachii]OXB11859.1 hypothetical protein B0A68_20360 [Flavobacterium reichenbachii]
MIKKYSPNHWKIVILITIFLFISLLLQLLLVGTAPKINCDEVYQQLNLFINTLIVEYAILVLVKILLLKFILKVDFKKILFSILVFTLLYISTFIYLFFSYYEQICR